MKGLLAQDEVPTSRRSAVTTYGALYQQWLTQDVERRLTPKVRSNYMILQRGYVLPYWSDVALDHIDPDRIAEWITWMETKTKSPWTMLESFSSMSACLTFAVHMQKLKVNPLQGMERLLPKRPKQKDRVLLDPQQILGLSQEVGDRYGALVLLMGAHGLRPSEALIEHVKAFCDASDGKSLLFPSYFKKTYIHTDSLRSIIVKPAAEAMDGDPRIRSHR